MDQKGFLLDQRKRIRPRKSAGNKRIFFRVHADIAAPIQPDRAGLVADWCGPTFGGPPLRPDTPMPIIRKRKYPLPTAFAFTKSRLLEEAERVKALDPEALHVEKYGF